MTQTTIDRPSTPSLIGDALRQMTALFNAEMQLARLEVTEKLVLALVSVASIIGAAIFIMVALIFLLQGLVEFLVSMGWPAFAASFAVGGGIALVAIVAIVLAVRNLSAAKLMPARTIRQAKGATEILNGGKP